jgi:type VI secretion system secreted protein VgrG
MTTRIEGLDYRVKLANAGAAEVRVRRVAYREQLNASYSLEIDCTLPQLRGEPIQKICNQLIGGDAELTIIRRMRTDVTEKICGIVIGAERAQSRFEHELRWKAGEKTSDEAMDMDFVVHVVPAFELLKMHTWGTGSWHERTYPEVLEKVLNEGLGAYGRAVENKTKQTNKIDHIVRPPGESLHDFARRLMQAAGITSYFTHEAGMEKLVMIDDNGGFMEGTQYQPRNQPFRVDYTQRHNVSENVMSVLGSSSLGPKKFEYDSFDPVGTPPVELAGNDEGKGKSQAAVRIWGELRPTEIGDPEEQHKSAAKLLQQRDDTERNSVIARTTIIGMMPGRTYDLELKPDDRRTYVVESVRAEGQGSEYGNKDAFVNEVKLVPLTSEDGGTVDVRPTAPVDERKMPGLTLAQIEAVENHPVEVDKLHRVRIKFLWDQVEGESPTTWVSVMQPMAGLFGGSQQIPREGDRVVVAFHEGRTDRGVILGTLYDEQYKPPVMGPPDRSSVLPESALWLGWNHASVEPGKKPDQQGCLDRHTMLCMDVTANQELFYFNAPYDWRRDVGNDSETNIVRDSKVQIGRHETRDIKENLTETVGKNYTQETKEQRKETVGKDYTVEVEGQSKVTVEKKRTENYESLSRTTKQGTVETDEKGNRQARVLGGSYQIAVSDKFNVVASSVSLAVGGGGGSGPASGGALDLKSTATLEGPSGAVLKSGGSGVNASPQGVKTNGRLVETRDEGGASTKMENGSLVVDAPRGITFRCGASEVRLTPDGVYINGRLMSINAVNTQIETERFDVSGDS